MADGTRQMPGWVTACARCFVVIMTLDVSNEATVVKIGGSFFKEQTRGGPPSPRKPPVDVASRSDVF